MRRKADNPLYAEKSTGSSYPTDKKPHKQQQAKHKGSAHVAVSQPARAPVQQPTPQPTVSQSNQTSASSRGATPRSRNTSYPPCKYTCPSCSENHYAFSCSTFRSMAVPQRKEHVRVNTLCSTCLKPGHVPADCRSKFTCQVCFGSHNSLLHSDPSTGNPPSASGTVNLTSTIASETLDKSKLLAVGPILHPTLDHILLKFRMYRVALSGDITKMYREILLSPPDRQLHRFLWRPVLDQPVREYCMNRVTFGVASSPYLAVRTLQQTASDFGQEFPDAKWHVNHSFYVDDLLGGSDSIE